MIELFAGHFISRLLQNYWHQHGGTVVISVASQEEWPLFKSPHYPSV